VVLLPRVVMLDELTPTMKQGRNAKCVCGSGIKYKNCCLPAERERAWLAELERREQMKQRAEEARRKREQHLEYLRTNPETLDMRGIDPVVMALVKAIHPRRLRT
jgi:hypothetical protein